jgi:phage terminase small subunit
MSLTAHRKQDWGELGPCMRALPAKWRSFVTFYILENPGRGAQTNAARRAGFGTARSKPIDIAHIGWRLMSDERIQAAIAEEARKLLRGAAPEAAKALIELVRNPEHKDHARAVGMMLARTDPEITRHDMNITHKVVSEDDESLEELRALRQLGTTREKLVELFGGNGLARLEQLEAADSERRAASAKMVEGVVVNG